MTKEQERAQTRRRDDERDAGAARPVSEAKRDTQVAIGLVLALLLLAAFITVPKLMSSKDKPAADTTAAADTGTEAPTNADGLIAGQTLAEGCTKPPALQKTPKTFKNVPDKAKAAGKTFVATVDTNCGKITMELDGAKAPQTVASFESLASNGYWAPSPCHRLTTEGLFVLQCGDPTGTGAGGPGYGYGIENAPKDGKYPAGTLAMARTQDPNSNGGQFFIVHKDTELPTEGGGYSIFGKVTGGMDIVQRIVKGGSMPHPNDPQLTIPKNPISITGITVTEKKA